nr:hypothetical protein [Gluconacetobacter dulcium]
MTSAVHAEGADLEAIERQVAGKGLREARRVLAPLGCALFIDVTAPLSALADSWLQTLELLRDVSHVRDCAVAEWMSLLGGVEEDGSFTLDVARFLAVPA